MLKRSRRDGTLVKNVPPFTALMPYLMPDKKGSAIFYEQDLDITDTLAYIKKVNRVLIKKREILTLFEVVLCAALRAVVFRPRLNRFISGCKYYQRNQLILSFVAKREITDEGEEMNIKMPLEPDETLESLARKVKTAVKEATLGNGQENKQVVDAFAKLPHTLLKFLSKAMVWVDQHNLMPYSVTQSDPMYSTVFLANVGSFGLDAPFHHLFEWGNSPIFLAVGNVRTERILDAEGKVQERKKLRLRYTFDDRIADGVYMSKALGLVQKFVEHPEELSTPPEIPEALLAELNLRPSSQ